MARTLDKGIVYLVDDDESLLRMLRHLVDSVDHIEVRTYTSADAFIAGYRPGGRECLVSDMCMPGTGGLELQERLRELGMALPVIFISGSGEVGAAVAAMKKGAFDYLEKPFVPRDFLQRVGDALAESGRRHAQMLAWAAREQRLAQLTAKEREIVGMVVDGRSSREISEFLAISVRTVENHRARIMEKLDVHSAVALVKLLG